MAGGCAWCISGLDPQGAQSDLKLMPKNEVLECDLAPGSSDGKNTAEGQEQEVEHPSGYPASHSALYGVPELDTL